MLPAVLAHLRNKLAVANLPVAVGDKDFHHSVDNTYQRRPKHRKGEAQHLHRKDSHRGELNPHLAALLEEVRRVNSAGSTSPLEEPVVGVVLDSLLQKDWHQTGQVVDQRDYRSPLSFRRGSCKEK